MADYFTLLIDTGRFKIASATANDGMVNITHLAVGDGNGQSVNPVPSQTALVHEVWRTQVESVETDPNNPAAVIVKAIIPHDAGGWWMREIGIFDSANELIAVVKCLPEFKPTAAQGQIEDILYEFQLVIGEQANIVLLVNPSLMWATRDYVESRFVPMRQMMNTPWLPVKAMDVVAPPAGAAIGDAYLIPLGATDEWSGKSGQLAEWNGVSWNFISPKDGHGVGLPDGSVYVRESGAYKPLGQGLPGQRDNWRAVRSMTVKTPPANAGTGDAYLIPAGSTGEWTNKSGQIAIRDDDKWIYITPQDGHGLGLPDGRLFIRHDGSYTEKIAADVQSGKWLYAEAGGEPDALTATLTPPPSALVDGMKIRLKPGSTNTGPVTLDINGLGAKEIKDQKGSALGGNMLLAGSIVELIYDGIVWRTPSLVNPAQNWIGQNGYQFLPGGLILQWGQVSAKISYLSTHSFPIAFPNACCSLVGEMDKNGSTNKSHLSIYKGVSWNDKTQFHTFINESGFNTGQNVTTHFIAIGY